MTDDDFYTNDETPDDTIPDDDDDRGNGEYYIACRCGETLYLSWRELSRTCPNCHRVVRRD